MSSPRQRRRQRWSPPLDPNLTPLLDVVLQLIAFFMMLVHFGVRIEGATDAVRLPVAAAALPRGDLSLDRIVVALLPDGRLQAGEQLVEPGAIQAFWREQAERRREGLEAIGAPARLDLPTAVVVRADRAATYQQVRSLLQAAQGAGFSRFTLVVRRQEEGRL